MRNIAAPRAPDGWPDCPLSVGSRSGRVLCSAGNRPNSKPVPSVSTAANARTVGSSWILKRGLLRQHRGDQVEHPLRDQQPDQPADRRQDQRLGQQLPDQLRAVGADRQAHGHFTAAPSGAGQQQVGDVGARDQQHQAGHAEQHLQRLVAPRRGPCSAPGHRRSITSVRARNSCIRWSLKPRCSGASTSLISPR